MILKYSEQFETLIEARRRVAEIKGWRRDKNLFYNADMTVQPSETGVRIEKAPSPPKKWGYQTFKEYLLAQPRGQEFLLPLNEFPEEMELSNDWHGVFNKMREKTNKDQIERVALVGYSLDQRAIYLPREEVAEIPWSFERNVPVSTDAKNFQRASAKLKGADGLTGILHSHPSHDIKVLGFTVKTGRLSAGDLYDILVDAYGPMIGVVAGSINSLAFRTRESIVPRDNHEKFYDLWEREPQPPKLDELLAQQYHIALYKGNVNGVLKRIHPRR